MNAPMSHEEGCVAVLTPEGQVEPGASPVDIGKPRAPPVPRLGGGLQNKVRRSRGRGGNKLWISYKRVLVEAGGLPAGETVCGVKKHKLGPGTEIVIVVIKNQAGGGHAGFDMNDAGDAAGENVVLEGDIRGAGGRTGSVQIEAVGLVLAQPVNEMTANNGMKTEETNR